MLIYLSQIYNDTTTENFQSMSRSTSFLCPWSGNHRFLIALLQSGSLSRKIEEVSSPLPSSQILSWYLLWQSSARKFCDKMKCWKTKSQYFSSFIFNLNFGRFCAADWQPAMTWLTIDRFTQDSQAKPKTSYINDWLITRSIIIENNFNLQLKDKILFYLIWSRMQYQMCQ